MKTKTIVLLVGLAFSCGCRRARPALIPEISPPLVQEEVCTWAGQMAGDLIFPCAAGIGWVDADGRIVFCDLEKKTAAAVFDLSFPVTLPPFRQGNFLVLKDQASDHLLIYDVVERKVKFESRNMGEDRILGVDDDCLVYLDGERLAVRLWKMPAGIFFAPEAGKEYFNCHFSPDRVLILGREQLIIFWRKSGRFERRPLPLPASSPFFCDGDNIYYGSTQRYLVKFSLPLNRAVWKLRLGQILERQPCVFAGSIVVNPADNNVLQVNERGSVLWWLALQSTMSFELSPMSDHLAAVLLNHEIKFINLRRKQVIAFKSQGAPVSRPLVFGHDLYFMLREGKKLALQRIGNRYGVEITLEPAKVRWTGRSVGFSVQTRNLLKPSWECVISDAAGRTVYSKAMETAERTSLVWMPLAPGKFKITVSAKAVNRDERSDVSVQVLDPYQIVPGFFWHF
jgi:hypothetical protein